MIKQNEKNKVRTYTTGTPGEQYNRKRSKWWDA